MTWLEPFYFTNVSREKVKLVGVNEEHWFKSPWDKKEKQRDFCWVQQHHWSCDCTQVIELMLVGNNTRPRHMQHCRDPNTQTQLWSSDLWLVGKTIMSWQMLRRFICTRMLWRQHLTYMFSFFFSFFNLLPGIKMRLRQEAWSNITVNWLIQVMRFLVSVSHTTSCYINDCSRWHKKRSSVCSILKHKL